MGTKNYDLTDAIVLGRAYLQRSLRAGYTTGQGTGSLARLGWPLHDRIFRQFILRLSLQHPVPQPMPQQCCRSLKHTHLRA